MRDGRIQRRGALGLVLALAAGLATLALGPAAQTVAEADVILIGGEIWTGAGGALAEAVAVAGDRIIAVGSAADVARHQGEATRVVELDGRFVSPGFIDNHTHFNRAGELLLGVNLLEVADRDGLVRQIRETAARLPAGAWMVGGMWGAYEQWALSSTGRDQDRDRPAAPFSPSRADIDSVSPTTPALLWNWDRSQYLANGAALEAAGADCGWEGVECLEGAPTGRLTQEAANRIRQAIPPKTLDQKLAEARVALARLREHGVTTFFDITPPDQVEVYHALRESGELTSRVNMRLVLDTWDEMRDAGVFEGFGDEWIRYQGLKGFVDGIMGNSSARFYEPYVTTGVRGAWRDPSNTGYVTDDGSGYNPDGNMERLVFGADSAGFNPRVHAIGDEAIDRILDIFERVQEVNGRREGRRFAVIHNQVLRGPETAAREAELGVIAEMQPYHTIDDMRWMEERIGDRARWAYAFKTLADAGVLLSFGSDWPGTNAAWYTSNPLHGMYAAVTRETLGGTPAGGWFPEEKIDAETALKAYTVNNAWVAGEEEYKGKIQEGFLADIAVLDANPLAVEPGRLKDVRVLMTIVGGRVVFERPAT
jgi:predicted amidohydrolase YtcJ